MGLEQVVQGITHDLGKMLDIILIKSSLSVSVPPPSEIDKDIFCRLTYHFCISLFVNFKDLQRKKENKVVYDQTKIEWLSYRENMKSPKIIPRTARNDFTVEKWIGI